jgi:hypothetical protein
LVEVAMVELDHGIPYSILPVLDEEEGPEEMVRD